MKKNTCNDFNETEYRIQNHANDGDPGCLRFFTSQVLTVLLSG